MGIIGILGIMGISIMGIWFLGYMNYDESHNMNNIFILEQYQTSPLKRNPKGTFYILLMSPWW